MENIFSVIMKQINSFNKENLVIAVDGRCAAGKNNTCWYDTKRNRL